MPWKCPACSTQIQHSELDTNPRPQCKYRCHICRLELVVDRETNKLTVAPLQLEDDRAHTFTEPR